jgi:RNA polymerase sigma-70 factor (ECF subfamily)
MLIRQIAEGDQAALQMLVRRYEPRVHRFIRRIVGDCGLSEEVTSETFFAVWQRAKFFESRSSVATWLLAIARYKALSARVRRTDQCTLAEVEDTLADPTETPDEALAREGQLRLLRRCLALLPAEQERLIQLVYYHEKSVKEAAIIVGIPENTAKSRMFLARKKLAIFLNEANNVAPSAYPRAHKALHELTLKQQKTDEQRRRSHQRGGADDCPIDALIA